MPVAALETSTSAADAIDTAPLQLHSSLTNPPSLNDYHSQKVNKQVAKISSLNAEIASLKDKIIALEAKNDTLKTKKDNLENNTEILVTENVDLQQSNNTLKAKTANLELEQGKLNKRVNKLFDKWAQSYYEGNNVRAERNELRKENRKISCDKNRLEEEKEKLEDNNYNLSLELSQSKNRVRQLEDEANQAGDIKAILTNARDFANDVEMGILNLNCSSNFPEEFLTGMHGKAIELKHSISKTLSSPKHDGGAGSADGAALSGNNSPTPPRPRKRRTRMPNTKSAWVSDDTD